MTFSIEVNGKQIKAQSSETILTALVRNGIKIPTLCFMEGFMPTGACRMCVVEIEGKEDLIPACSYPIEKGMKIHTHSPRVIKARKTVLELLLSNHPDDCLYCERNGSCELQKIAKELNIKDRRFYGKKNTYKTDQSSPSIFRDPSKCILCGRCVRVCGEIEKVHAIDFIGKGNKAFINSAFNKGLNVSSCINCGQCIIACPTGALHEISHLDKVMTALNNPEKTVVASIAPTISVSIAEEFGIRPGTDLFGVIVAALRKIGFKYVFDTSFSADLTIIEEAAELAHRIQNNGVLPIMTSCCPAWIKYVEEFKADYIRNLSTCKSPQQMMGALIKNYFSEQINEKPENIFSVSIMPCTAKKFESSREEMTNKGISDVDAVLTTRELVKMIKLYGLDFKNIEVELPDNPLGMRSSAGKLFANAGGLSEAIIRTFYYQQTGEELLNYKIDDLRGEEKIKYHSIKIGKQEIKVVVVSGISNAQKILEDIENKKLEVHLIEVMACPNGCIAGGGQIVPQDYKAIKARMKSIYDTDKIESIKAAHQNPAIKDLYDNYLTKPLSEKSRQILHTHYSVRNVLK